MNNGKLIIFSAPSGSGKSTITQHLLKVFPQLEFSVSATSRAPRGIEQNGVDYYFVTPETFRQMVANDELVEWEEVYKDNFYGTRRSELERVWSKGHTIVFDIDVQGGLNLKKMFGDKALSVFVMPPSIDELRKRLEIRATDAPEVIERRLAKAEHEIAHAEMFDVTICNDNLARAFVEAEQTVRQFLGL